MRETAIILAFFYFLVSCAATKVVFFKVTTKTGQQFKYSLKIPKGYSARKMSFEHENINTYSYPDSSLIYFSDDPYPSAFYEDAYKRYGKNINIIFMTKDTITISGKDGAGNYWKTCKWYNVVYGYTQVPFEKVREFDLILTSLKK